MSLNRNHFAEFFRVDYYTVNVTFDDTDFHCRSYKKPYTYKVPKHITLKEGDKVLVYANDLYKVTTVEAVNPTPQIDGAATFRYKWIVGPIGPLLEEHEANIAKDNRLKQAVATLEASLAKVRLRKEITAAMSELPEEELARIRELFGADLVLPAQEAKNE